MYLEFHIPVHNEEKILKKNVTKLWNFLVEQNFNFDWEIIIIINGSNDNSLEIAKQLQKEYPNQIKVNHIIESGKGNAIKKSINSSKADVAIYMDVDLAVSLKNIPDLINPILNDNYDLVIGSRLLINSKIDRSFIRELSSQSYNFLSKIILQHHFSDLQCGFKAIKVKKFQKISPFTTSKKWFFDTELITFAKLFKFKIKEIPVDWSENRYNDRKSKINLIQDSLKFIYNLLRLKIRILKHLKTLLSNKSL